jgi:hypothetical protein
VTISELCIDALVEINAASAGQPVQPEILALALRRLNLILDQFNATDQKLYADLFSTYNIPVTGNPITIGPTGVWVYPIARPNLIPQAAVILNTGSAPYVRIPLSPMTPQQWQNLATPTLAATLPNRFFYNPTSPNGEFYFWTVANTAYQVQLLTRQMLSQVTTATTFAQPPGYWAALMLRLAKALKSPLRKPWTQDQEQELMKADLIAFGNNSFAATLGTQDAGMPTSGGTGTRGDFNYLNGMPTG